MTLWREIIKKTKMKYFLIVFFSLIYSFTCAASNDDSGYPRLEKFLYFYDTDNIAFSKLNEADSSFNSLIDFGEGESMVYTVNAECSVCIAQFLDFLLEYSNYLADNVRHITLYVFAKGNTLEIIKYYINQKKAILNPHTYGKIQKLLFVLTPDDSTELHYGLYYVMENKIVRYDPWKTI